MVGGPVAPVEGTVVRARSGFYTVLTDAGLIECRLRGRVKKEQRASDLVVIGDVVKLERLTDGTGSIASVATRRTKFSRRQPGPRGSWREDVMVANLDQAVVVFACADPAPHLRMVDRFLVVAEQNEIEPLLIANKIDLVGPAAARALFGEYEKIGYPVLYTSARSGAGVDALRGRLAGRVSVVTGPSGAGKSTLLNAIQPGLRLATAEVSEALGKGRHTTTTAELLPLDDGGFVADTPGLRELGLWQVEPHQLGWHFPEFRVHLGGCVFNDCSHLHEPGCAVRAAVDAGRISPERYESYRRLHVGDSA